MPVKKSELYSSLWKSCDELRGSMDASQYKDYVLVLLFVKYVSDRNAGQPDALIEVPAGGSFADMVSLKGDKEIGDKINKIIARLAEANDYNLNIPRYIDGSEAEDIQDIEAHLRGGIPNRDIDAPMQDHGLFQAICRVNRLDGEDKEYGDVIDYRDLFQSLERSIHDYAAGAFEGYDKEDVPGR